MLEEREVLKASKGARTNTRIILAIMWLNLFLYIPIEEEKIQTSKEIETKLENMEKQNRELKSALDSLTVRLSR
jgi:hypothetical protein